MKNLKHISCVLLALLLAVAAALSGCEMQPTEISGSAAVSLNDILDDYSKGLDQSSSDRNEPYIPPYTDSAFCVINDNIPAFSNDELTTDSYEFYASRDSLGRCSYAIASVGVDIMPTEDRGNIGSVKPTGWHTVKYDIVDGKYLYNRCHLIGFQLTGENANVANLITGTRYMNVEGMLPFENMIADYVKETKNHVAYRVTPIFEGDNLLADGVQLEAFSIEDNGEGICFNVFCYNVQPGIVIDYATGESHLADSVESSAEEGETLYILNENSKKFHLTSCSSAADIAAENYAESQESRDELINRGYTPCKRCNP